MNAVKIGQVWRDKDKRRDRTVTVIDVFGETVLVSNIATGKETELQVERFIKRWEQLHKKAEKVTDKPEPGEPLYSTREAWLEAGVQAIIPLFEGIPNVSIPKVRVSVGWPGGRGKKGSVIGQCWKTETASDKVSQIFISPVVEDPAKAVATLTHELIHASDDGESGHKGHFARVAKALGFTGKLTSVIVNDEISADADLISRFEALADTLGPYPHAALSERAKPKTQKTYMVLLESVSCTECEPGYKLRMTQKWLDEVGAPLCPHGIEMEQP